MIIYILGIGTVSTSYKSK